MQAASRLARELAALRADPPQGVACWAPDDADTRRLCARGQLKLVGPPDSPYADGVFALDVSVPDRYPFEPPRCVFATPVHHPNIDAAGRICLDLLKMPPKGSWKPSINLATLLTSLRVLLGSPNPDDPLVADIAQEYIHNYPLFVRKARDATRKYAMGDSNLTRPDDAESTSTTSLKNLARSSPNLAASSQITVLYPTSASALPIESIDDTSILTHAAHAAPAAEFETVTPTSIGAATVTELYAIEVKTHETPLQPVVPQKRGASDQPRPSTSPPSCHEAHVNVTSSSSSGAPKKKLMLSLGRKR